MIIHVTLNVQGLQGKVGQVVAYFYNLQGQPLRASFISSLYKTPDNHVVVAQDFVPGYESTNYNDFQLFMPYSGLNMGGGEQRYQDLKYHVVIFDKSSVPAQQLAASSWQYFTWMSSTGGNAAAIGGNSTSNSSPTSNAFSTSKNPF